MNIFERIGISPVINATGAVTRLSGGIMAEEVARAMAEATQHCVDMTELQARASEIIAAATGAEAGYVTSGAAAGLLLGTAACMTGLNPGRMARLPLTAGMRSEVVMVRSQRNFYDHAVRTTGAMIVEVGLPDRYAGAGMRDAEEWEIADAISDATACVVYIAGIQARPSLREVVRVAHAAGIPVVVDAAAQLPPAANLRRFTAEGADLVAFSGGKVIGGPQASGILCGRRDLIMAVALQQLDLDVLADYWSPPSSLIDLALLRGIPQHGIGRPCKVGKEGIVGMLKALEIFLSEGDATRHARWLATARLIEDGLKGIPHTRVEIYGENDVESIPRVALELESSAKIPAGGLIRELQKASPRIYANPEALDRNTVLFNPICLKPGEAETIVQVAKTLLAA